MVVSQDSGYIARAMKYTHNLYGVLGGIVDDQVGEHRPEFHGSVRQVLAAMSSFRISAEKLHRSSDLLENMLRDTNTTLFNKIFFDCVKILFRIW